jgi:2-isopropylmalate synthase
MARLELLDTTIRDGELSPAFNPSFEQRIQIAQALDRAGIDIVELASTADDGQSRSESRQIAARLKTARACCISQVSAEHIEIARGVLDGAEQPRIHLYLDAGRVHGMAKSDADRIDAVDTVSQAITMARNYIPEVQFSPQDATRCEQDSLFALIAAAIAAGAQVINISDTTGTATPALIANLLNRVREAVPEIEQTTLSLHAHNHLRRATDNVFSAIDFGVRQIEGTINGVGPAGGNTNLNEVVYRIGTDPRAKSLRLKTSLDLLQAVAQESCFAA